MGDKIPYRSRIAKKPESLFWTVWAGAIFLLLLRNTPAVLTCFLERNSLRAIIFLYIFSALLIFRFLYVKYKDCKDVKFCAILFVSALSIRLGFLIIGQYVPTNDFANYYELGRRFYNFDFSWIKNMVNGYQISKLAGLSIFYGILSWIFSPTLLGTQIINCILTSGICVFVFLLGRTFSRRAAFVAAFLYMVYPTNILASQVTTNHHAASFFLIIALYEFYLLITDVKSIARMLFISILLVVSDMMHPSVIIVVCVLIAYSSMRIFEKLLTITNRDEKRKEALTVFLKTICTCVLYFVILNLTLFLMERAGLCDRTIDSTLLSKVRVGMDIEHGGYWWPGGYTEVAELPTIEEQRDFCLKEIKRNMKNPIESIRLFWRKTNIAWFSGDGYIDFYLDGTNQKLAAMHQKYEEQNEEDKLVEIEQMQLDVYNKTVLLQQFDSLFIYGIWIFAFIGLIFLIRTPYVIALDLIAWLPLGWMAFICFSELQTRYRYQSMPSLILLAGFGIVSLYDHIKAYWKEHSMCFPWNICRKTGQV